MSKVLNYCSKNYKDSDDILNPDIIYYNKTLSDNNKKRFSDPINREKNKNSMKNFWANLTPERRLEITNKMKKPKRKNYV